jgi:hypothetical protein
MTGEMNTPDISGGHAKIIRLPRLEKIMMPMWKIRVKV